MRNERAVGVWPYLFVALIMFARTPTPLIRAEFWAEDGPQFFNAALAQGIGSLWTPVYGHHFLISRLIAYLATWFPVVLAPYIYAWSSLALNALATAYFAREGFSWLLCSRSMRIFTCLVLTVGPGTAEVFVNLSNLPAALTLLGLLMLLERPFALSGRKMVALAILFFSAGQMFLLAPLIAALFWVTRDRRYVVLMCLLILVAVLNLIGNHTRAAEAGYRNYAAIDKVPAIYMEQFFLRAFVAPFVGPAVTGRFMAASAKVFWPGLALFAGCGAWVISRFRPPKAKVAVLALCYLLVTGIFVVIALSRNYALEQILRGSANVMWNHRYSYLPASVATLFWFSVVSGPTARWKQHAGILAMFVVTLITAHSVSQFRGYYQRPDLNWPRTAVDIQAALDLKKRRLLERPVTIDCIEVHPAYYQHRFFSVTVDP